VAIAMSTARKAAKSAGKGMAARKLMAK